MTQNPQIHRIDKENRFLKDSTDSESIIRKIIDKSSSKFGITINSNINKITKENINYYLYIYNSADLVSDWKEFLPEELTKNDNFTQQKLSLILFAETEFDIFCIVGGNAYQMILPFIDHSFGLNTYARIMKPELDELASIKSRGVTGTRAGINEQFRENFRIIDFIKFGKVPQEIHLKICQETTDLHFNFLKSKVSDRIQIYAGKGFKVKKSLDFENLHLLIKELCIISELEVSDYLSSYVEISDKDYINNFLNPELTNRLFNDIKVVVNENSKTYNRFEFDLCNPNNIEKFYEADEYLLKEKTEDGGYYLFRTVNDKSEIYEAVIRRATEKYGENDIFKFRVFLQGVRVLCYQNQKKTLGSSFLFHLNTELNIQGKSIFLIDTKWYHLRESFIKDLKTNTLHILKAYNAPNHILYLNWDKNIIKSEKDYNLCYNGVNNYIVIDTIIVDGIELCDIIYYDDNNLYLIHVKYSFSSKIRELTNQITISARRLKDILGSENKLPLEKIYGQLIEKGHHINNLSLDQFKKLFSKKITYLLAFTSHLKEDLEVENHIDKFDSNIARFSLIQCSSDMRANYYDMLTYQIKRQ